MRNQNRIHGHNHQQNKSNRSNGGGFRGRNPPTDPHQQTQNSGGVPQGKFTGFGPKSYHRTDDRIRDEVSDILTRHGLIDARNLEVQVKEGVVTLTGDLYSRRIKHLVEDVVSRVSGVKDIQNQIKIIERPETMTSGDFSPLSQGQARSQGQHLRAPS